MQILYLVSESGEKLLSAKLKAGETLEEAKYRVLEQLRARLRMKFVDEIEPRFLRGVVNGVTDEVAKLEKKRLGTKKAPARKKAPVKKKAFGVKGLSKRKRI